MGKTIYNGLKTAFILNTNENIIINYGNVKPDSNIQVGAYLMNINNLGTLNWFFKQNKNGAIGSITCSPLITSDNKIITTSESGTITALTLEGEKIWEYITNSFIVSGHGGINIDLEGNIYVSTISEFLVLSKQGELKWSANNYSRQNTVFNTKGDVLFLKNISSIDALDLNRNILWSYPIESGNYTVKHKLIDSFNNLYFLENNKILSIDKTGKLNWEFSHGESENIYYEIAPTIDKNGNIYFLTDKFLYSINYAGKLNWKFEAIEFNASNLICDSDGIIYLSKNNEAEIISVNSSGNLVWKISLGNDYFINSTLTINKQKKLFLIAQKQFNSYLICIE